MADTAMGCVGDDASARWGTTAIERDGWGLAAMAETAMGHVNDGASTQWGATAIECDGWGIGGLMGAHSLFGARGLRETGGSLERWA